MGREEALVWHRPTAAVPTSALAGSTGRCRITEALRVPPHPHSAEMTGLHGQHQTRPPEKVVPMQ